MDSEFRKYLCPSVILATGVLIIAWGRYAGAVDCKVTGVGRFADTTDTTCKNYTFCVYYNSTTYLAYNYTCPSTSVFNPASAKCTASSNYVCNVTTSVCTADEVIADPKSSNCSSYIQCVKINGTFIETYFSCPNNTYYNPNSTFCEPDYICPTTSTFQCSAAGRFANASDPTCQKYYFCVLSSNGNFLQYNYTCPTTSVFSPTSKVCTTLYTCPK